MVTAACVAPSALRGIHREPNLGLRPRLVCVALSALYEVSSFFFKCLSEPAALEALAEEVADGFGGDAVYDVGGESGAVTWRRSGEEAKRGERAFVSEGLHGHAEGDALLCGG